MLIKILQAVHVLMNSSVRFHVVASFRFVSWWTGIKVYYPWDDVVSVVIVGQSIIARLNGLFACTLWFRFNLLLAWTKSKFYESDTAATNVCYVNGFLVTSIFWYRARGTRKHYFNHYLLCDISNAEYDNAYSRVMTKLAYKTVNDSICFTFLFQNENIHASKIEKFVYFTVETTLIVQIKIKYLEIKWFKVEIVYEQTNRVKIKYNYNAINNITSWI